MVEEETSLENEIHKLCEKIIQINNSSIQKLRKNEEEKVVYQKRQLIENFQNI